MFDPSARKFIRERGLDWTEQFSTIAGTAAELKADTRLHSLRHAPVVRDHHGALLAAGEN
jgi:hypothetical protein